MKILSNRLRLESQQQCTRRAPKADTAAVKPMLVVLLMVFLAGCTNSKLIIGPLYGRLDDQMRKEFHKLGKFNKAQIAEFELRLGTYHLWHRKKELPEYAALINVIQASIRNKGDTSPDDVRQWMDKAEIHTKNIRTCHPVNFSFELMQTLTDKQVNFIERRFARERKKNQQKYNAQTTAERIDERSKNITKWARRVGFEFSRKQKQMLKDAMSSQISLNQPYYRLINQWTRALFFIARNQNAPDYTARMQKHFDKLWTLLESQHPDTWRDNQKIWQDFGFNFIQSMSREQRIYASDWLKRLAKTVNSISRDTPSFKPTGDPTHGCQPDTNASVAK